MCFLLLMLLLFLYTGLFGSCRSLRFLFRRCFFHSIFRIVLYFLRVWLNLFQLYLIYMEVWVVDIRDQNRNEKIRKCLKIVQQRIQRCHVCNFIWVQWYQRLCIDACVYVCVQFIWCRDNSSHAFIKIFWKIPQMTKPIECYIFKNNFNQISLIPLNKKEHKIE